jgi:hypothetical protein
MEISSGFCFSCAGLRVFSLRTRRRTLGPERVDPPVPALGVPYSSSRIDVLRSAPLRHASLAVALPKKSFFDLSVDAMQPLLRPVGFLSIGIGFSF